MSEKKISYFTWEIIFLCSNCNQNILVKGLESSITVVCGECNTEWRITTAPKVRKTEAQSNKELGY